MLRTRTASLLLLLALPPTLAPKPTHVQTSTQTPAPTPPQTQPPAQTPPPPPNQTIRIRILNAKTNQPIPDEKLNVALRADQIGSVAMPTDKFGIILVDTGSSTIIRILSNMYADCRSRGELYTNYSIATILKTGIATGNLCSAAKPSAKPGELILFEIPQTAVPKYPAPPAGSLPHSDEYPH